MCMFMLNCYIKINIHFIKAYFWNFSIISINDFPGGELDLPIYKILERSINSESLRFTGSKISKKFPHPQG